MRDKRFNNVAMLKRNSERTFRSPYEYAEACRLLAEYRAAKQPGGITWVDEEYRDSKAH